MEIFRAPPAFPGLQVAVAGRLFEALEHKGAITVAGLQQAKSWELRSAMSMARLWRDQRRIGEARDLLAPIYGWFTQGFEARDLNEAKVLLDELSS